MFLTAISAAALILGIYLVVRPASAARRTVNFLQRINVQSSARLLQLVMFLIGAFLFIFGSRNLLPK